MSKSTIKSIRGFADILPTDTPLWQQVEATAMQVLNQYAYQEIRTGLIEETALFSRSVGEATDIVNKEMYTFSDRDGNSLSLRPEGTASIVRAGIENGLLYNQTQKFWYMGPMFRYERPQKGRTRQFHQIGVEAFGFADPEIDLELLLLSNKIFAELDLLKYLTLEINTLGNSEDRNNYIKDLVKFFNSNNNLDKLTSAEKERLATNPLRILDSKNPVIKELLLTAPKLIDYVSDAERDRLDYILKILDQLKIKYKINSSIVRGLDYYSGIVFEWTTDKLGAQSAVCAGGRYDNLVENLGGKATSAIGMAFGIERLVLLKQLDLDNNKIKNPNFADIYIIAQGEAAQQQKLILAEKLRNLDKFNTLKIYTSCNSAKLKTQFKAADQSGAQLAIILAEQEMQDNNYSIKILRNDDLENKNNNQQVLAWDDLVKFIKDYLNL